MKDDRGYLGDIRDAINDIERCPSAGHDVFVAERMREDAVIRELEVLGEAVKHLFDDRKEVVRPTTRFRASKR